MTLNVSGGRLEIKLHLQPPTFLQDQRDMKENQQKKPTKPLMFAETWCGNLENLLSNFKVFSFFLKNNKKLTENCEIYATFCTYRKRCQDCKTPRTVAPRYINSLISPKPFLSSSCSSPVSSVETRLRMQSSTGIQSNPEAAGSVII